MMDRIPEQERDHLFKEFEAYCRDLSTKAQTAAAKNTDAQLFKQFQDNDSFRGWLTATVFEITQGESGR